MGRALTLAALAAALTAPMAAEAQTRAVVPIHQRLLSDGVRRYSVPITVDGQAVEAALDTGSVGLRLLPGVIPPRSGPGGAYVYAGGVELRGVQTTAELSMGGLSGRSELQLVSKIGCAAWRPMCSAKGLSADSFGFEGDGLAGEGFRAILGLSLTGGTDKIPLAAIGAQRWIVRLPTADGDGELIINPTEAETAGFVDLPLAERLAWRRDGAHDAIEGCLSARPVGTRVCGPVLLDTGAAGVAVVNAGGGPAEWAQGADLSFADLPPVELGGPGGRPIAAARIDDLPRPIVLAGSGPYLAFDVLYDPDRRLIGLKPRSAPPAQAPSRRSEDDTAGHRDPAPPR